MSFNSVLVLGAHPDDEMGCSGLVRRLADSGSKITAFAYSNCADLIPSGFKVEDLLLEYTSATLLLGINKAAVGLIPNRHFPEHRQAILSSMDELRGKYDLVLVPNTSDTHQDHHVVCEEAIRAFKHTTILGYDLAMNTVLESQRNCYVRLTPRLLDVKVKHVQTYRSQANRPYMAESFIRALATVRGVQAGCEAAESFEVIRWVM